jgi:hypothetical protein
VTLIGRIVCLNLILCTRGFAQGDWRGELAIEMRAFTQSALDSDQHDSNLSLSGEVEYYTSWDEGRQSFTIKPFGRVDQRDYKRTHVDLREAVWIYSDDGLELRAGVDKVFWGVTEVYHLVDIINQTDNVENRDGEQKLGQPMFKASLERDWGVLDLFLMPYFRERTFPSAEGRPRSQPRVAAELTEYENSREEYHTDAALRWSRYLGDWDLGIAHFYGTGREPSYRLGFDDDGLPVLIPRYEIIHQSSVDLQGAVGDWLWKFEGIHRKGQGPSFFAATGGFEYTFYGIADSSSDIGVLTELMWDERGSAATTPFDRDVFFGLRWVANDVDGTEVLTGLVGDWKNGTRFFNLEASRRVGNDWKLGLQARFWDKVDDSDALFGLRNDDYIEFKVSRYF